MKTIGLCMIVKNEAALIERCLDAVKPLIDYALISDTGSSDGTQEIVRGWLGRNGVAGKVVEEPWQDFGHNRSLALAELRQRQAIDYALVVDADDLVAFEEGFDVAAFKAGMDRDLYHVEIRLGPIRYHRAQILSNRQPWQYRGVVHEFADLPDMAPHSIGTASGIFIIAGVRGARSADPEKYHKDAVLLETAMLTETDEFMRRRYIFYIGQSWRDAGHLQQAIAAYAARAAIGGWDEEQFYSFYQIGLLYERLEQAMDMSLGNYLLAWDCCPHRSESLWAAARLCRLNRRFDLAYTLSNIGRALPEPAAGLFIEPWIYRWGLLDEYSIAAYWTGHYTESFTSCLRLLHEGLLPEEMQERVTGNLKFAQDKLTPGS